MVNVVDPASGGVGTVGSQTGRRRLVAAVVATVVGLSVSVLAVLPVVHRGWFGGGGPFDVLATVLFVASGPAALAGAVVLHRLRPGNPSVAVMYALGIVLCIWAGSVASTTTATRYLSTSVVLIRPLLFWLVLAWPIGRLTKADRRWLTVYTVAVAVCWMTWILVDPTGASAVPPFDNKIAIVDLSRLSTALSAFAQNVLLPAGAVIVIVTVVRRHRRLPASARHVGRAALLAGLVAATGDLVLLIVNRYLQDLLSHGDQRTVLGALVSIADQGRFIAVPLLLVAAAWASRRAAPVTTVRQVEIGPASTRVRDAIALALGDDSVRVAYHRDGSWFDADGLPVQLGGPGRHVTVVERTGVPVAAIDHDEAFDDRPTTVEVAVAAAASAMEYDRLVALARSRMREAADARRMIVEVEDAARRRIERDLHDGAQQRLVGLALQASLAERGGRAAGRFDAGPLAAGVAEASAELHDLASGVLPSILAERGLSAAIATLAATTPLAVDMHVSFPSELPVEVALTAWFVVAEAIANAVKHAAASALRIDGRVTGDRLHVSVADDGVGGASEQAGSGLRGLRERARACGGRLVLESSGGRGTLVALELPVGT